MTGRGSLRPDALPTDTSVRFLLLIVTFVTASLYLFQSLWLALNSDRFAEAAARCLPAQAQSTTTIEVAANAARLQGDCLSSVNREQAVYAFGGAALLAFVAWGLYRLRPLLRERRSHLLPLDAADGAPLMADVDEMAASAGILAPVVRVDATNPAVQGFAYGAGRRQRLGMTGGLVVQRVLRPDAFRAVVRHELGHVANRDVNWTYYTLSSWWAFLVVGMLPVLIAFAVSAPQYLLRLGWRVAVLSLMLLVVGAALLRTREVYADARAAQWGSREALDALLAAEAPPQGRRPAWMRVHPSPEARRTLLAEPDGLFRADALAAVAGGLAAGTGFAGLGDIFVLVLDPLSAYAAAAVPIALLIAVVTCLQSWRVGLREAVRGGRFPLALPLGAGVGVGLAVGPWVTLRAAVGSVADGVAGWLGYAGWTALMVVLTVLLIRWVADSASVRVASVLHRRSPLRALIGHICVAWLLFALLLAAGAPGLVLLREFGPGLVALFAIDEITGSAFLGYWTIVGAAAVVVLALVTWRALLPSAATGRGGDEHGRAWFLLPESDTSPVPAGDGSARPEKPVRLPRLLTLVVIGGSVGLVAGCGLVAVRLLGGLMDESVRGTVDYLLAVGASSDATVRIAAVVATVAASAVVPMRWWPVSLLSGGLALVVCGVMGEAANVATGCGLLPNVTTVCSAPTLGEWQIFVANPAREAAPSAFFLAALVGVVRAVAVSVRERRPAGTSAPGGTRAWAVAATVAAVAVMALVAGAEALRPFQVTSRPVVGAGFEVDLPPDWTGSTDPGSGLTKLDLLDADVAVFVQPTQFLLPTTNGPAVVVGSRTADLVRTEEAEGRTDRLYQAQVGSVVYLVLVSGPPDALTARAGDIERVLASFRWR